jgi:hypothetical protein
VGTRGKSLGGFQGLLPGSVSKYCLQHSPVPVIVVRPTSKRDKARSKRANDPDRQGYRDILAKSESLIDVNSPRNSFFANDEEALAANATAVANKQTSENVHPLAQVAHAEESDDEREASATNLLDDPRSPGVMMKSPHLQNLDSPDFSDDPSSGEEEDEGGVNTNPASEIAQGRGGLNFIEDEGISPMGQPTANPLDATETAPTSGPTITVTDPDDPSRVNN